MAAKKPRLVRTAVPVPPEIPPAPQREHPALMRAVRCASSGLVAGTVKAGGPDDHRGVSQLVVIEPGRSEPRRLGSLEENLGTPSIAPDGSRVIVPSAGPQGVIEVTVATGEARRIWEGGVPPDGYNIHAATYCGEDRAVLYCGFAFALMRREGRNLALESTLGSTRAPINGHSVTTALEGRVLIAEHTTKQTLVGLTGGSLVVLGELANKKGSWISLGDRVLERDAAGAWKELANLAELCC